jgi:hypothetical protein
MDKDGVSLAEAPEVERLQTVEFANEAERIKQEQAQKAARKQSVLNIEKDVLSKITETGFSKYHSSRYAKLTALMYGTLADTLKTSPEEVYKRFGLDLYSRMLAVPAEGSQFAQESPESPKGGKGKAPPAAQAPQDTGMETPTSAAPAGGSLMPESVVRDGKKVRGSITFAKDITQTPTVISLLEDANLSTYLHELGHFYLEILNSIATQPDAPQRVTNDMNAALAWFGVDSLAAWNALSLEEKRPYHEQFARGFEAYLYEGKAPTTELTKLFNTLRTWLKEVYLELTRLNVKLSAEVRGVFDRMLATDEAIRATEEVRGYTSAQLNAAAFGMTEEEWITHLEGKDDATEEAISEMQARSLRDMNLLGDTKKQKVSELSKEAKERRTAIEQEVTAELRKGGIYAAFRFMSHGEIPAAFGDVTFEETKLSISALEEMYGEPQEGEAPVWKQLRDLQKGKNGFVIREGGLHPDVIAPLFGFSSGDHLVKAMLAATPEAQAIKELTDTAMIEKYGELGNPQSIDRAANKALHNEARLRFVATAYKGAARAAGSVRAIMKGAKDFAATIIARKRLFELVPSEFEAAEIRAANKLPSLVGDPAAFAVATKHQLLNNALAKEAHEVLDYVQASLKFLRNVTKDKAIDPEARTQIEALLERYNLGTISNKAVKKQRTLEAWAQAQRVKGLTPLIDGALRDETVRGSYKEMRVEDFKGLVDTIANIAHLGKLKQQMLTEAEKVKFEETIKRMVDSIKKNANRTRKDRIERNAWADTFRTGGEDYLAMHRKFASVIREMDGFEDGGVMFELFSRKMNACGDTEAAMREKATERLIKLFEPIYAAGDSVAQKVGAMARTVFKGPGALHKVYIPEINTSLSLEGRIMVALNAGTEGNLQRLMSGDQWSQEQVTAVINTLTKEQMDFVQAIWDFLSEYRKDIAAQQKRFTGMEPNWVEPRVVQTKHGAYRGGYLPAKYDHDRSSRAIQEESDVNLMDLWMGADTKTKDSFLKERSDAVYNRPVRKDFNVIFQHVNDVVHRLAWQDFLFDANRLLNAGPVEDAIRKHYGPETLKQLQRSLVAIAEGEIGAQNAFEAAVNYVRTGAVVAGMAWRLTTSIMQVLGITNSMARIGTKYVFMGMRDFVGSPQKMAQTYKTVYAKSNMMRMRSKTLFRELNEIRNTIQGHSPGFRASYFYLLQKLQSVVDVITWLSQYNKSVEQGADEASAVAQSDQAVLDTQGGGQIKDLAEIQRGGVILRLATAFYSYFNVVYNLTAESYRKTNFKDPAQIGAFATDMLLLYSVPSAMGTLMMFTLKGGFGGDEWEEKLAKQLAADQASYMLGTLVGVRELGGVPQVLAGNKADYQGPAGTRLIPTIYSLGKQTAQGEVDAAFAKAAAHTTGALFHLPSGQVYDTLSGVKALSEGQTDNPGALIVGPRK